MLELPQDFPHTPPNGHTYELDNLKAGLVRIWLRHPDHYNYTSDVVRTVWGFYNTKKKVYCAPVNSKKSGNVVDIDKTTPYTAMQIVKPMRPTVLSFC